MLAHISTRLSAFYSPKVLSNTFKIHKNISLVCLCNSSAFRYLGRDIFCTLASFLTGQLVLCKAPIRILTKQVQRLNVNFYISLENNSSEMIYIIRRMSIFVWAFLSYLLQSKD